MLLRLLTLALLCSAAPLRSAAPDVEAILRKFIETSEDPELEARRNSFAYQRTSQVNYLDDDGSTRRTRVRVYRVTPENGRPVTRLISVNGRAASDPQEKERSAARETGEKSRSIGVSEELLSRFNFTFLREETFASRPMWVLAFRAREDAPRDDFMDKLINAMSGAIWIDQEDSQMAKAEIKLSDRVSFFGGLAGAIHKLDLTVFQRRIEPSIWLTEAIHIDFSGRKLFSSMRFRCFETCSNFENIPVQHASASNLPAEK